MNREYVFNQINRARDIADRKWGKNTLSTCGDDKLLGLAILAEEFGEVARAVLEKNDHQLLYELIDILQVASAWVESFEESADPEIPKVVFDQLI